MAYPSVTYTITNGTTADGSQVAQNFTDLVNGLSDGTKDLSINALNVAGAATFNGNVTLGNASGDDVTVTGSLASSIPIKTNNSYDIGSATLGLRKLYLGNAGAGATCDIVAASHATTREYTVPDCSAAASFVMTEGTQTVNGAKTFATAGNSWKGITSGSAPTSGYIGEKIEQGFTSVTCPNAYDDNFQTTTLDLTAGVWLVFYEFLCRHANTDNAYAIYRLRNTTDSTNVVEATCYVYQNKVGIPVHGFAYLNISGSKSYRMQIYDGAGLGSIAAGENTGGLYSQNKIVGIRIA